jgi:hypothetical protein
VREGARQAGREVAKLEIMAAAAVWTSDDLSIPADHRDKHRLMEIVDLNVLEMNALSEGKDDDRRLFRRFYEDSDS